MPIKHIHNLLVFCCMVLCIIPMGYISRLIVPLPTSIYDAGGYWNLSLLIHTQGLLNFGDSVRTYGYPLFVSTILGNGIWLKSIAINKVLDTQLILLVLSSSFAVLFLNRLVIAMGDRYRRWVGLIIMVMVMFNPLLLAHTRELLTEILSTFLLTLLFVLVVYKQPGPLGLVAGLVTVVRPFHHHWFLLLLALSFMVVMYIGRSKKIINSSWLIRVARLYFITLACFLLPVLLQYSFTYKMDRSIGITPKNKFIALHLSSSIYTYKYETYVPGSTHTPDVWYQDLKLEHKLSSCKGNLVTRSTCYLSVVPVILRNIVIKTVGLFMNFEWSTYRYSLTNSWNSALTYSMLVFILYIIGTVGELSHIINRIKSRRLGIAVNLVVFLLIQSYIFMYAAFTIPESRFVLPLYPVIIALGIEHLAKSSNKYILAIEALVSMGVFIMVWKIISSALI